MVHNETKRVPTKERHGRGETNDDDSARRWHRKAIVNLQTKYVPCFDMLEKETSAHLVEVWETVLKIVAVTAVGGDWTPCTVVT